MRRMTEDDHEDAAFADSSLARQKILTSSSGMRAQQLLASFPINPMECGSGIWISECVTGSAAL